MKQKIMKAKCIWTLVAVLSAFAVLSGAASAELLVQELFNDYTIGDVAQGLAVGGTTTGLTGTYSSDADPADKADIGSGTLIWGTNGIAAGWHTGAYPGGNADPKQTLDLGTGADANVWVGLDSAATAALSDGSVVWFSALVMNQSFDGGRSNYVDIGVGTDINNYAGIRFSADFEDGGVEGESGNIRIMAVENSAATVTTGSCNAILGTAWGYHAVGKITFGAGTDGDTIEIYFPEYDVSGETPTITIPECPASTLTATLDNASFDQLIIIGEAGNERKVDEIMIATDPADIGIDAVTTPGTCACGSEEGSGEEGAGEEGAGEGEPAPAGPAITPSAAFAIDGKYFSLTAPAGAVGDYVWNKDGGAALPTTTATLEFDPITEADAGSYSVTYDDGSKAPVVLTLGVDVLPAGNEVPLTGLLGLGLLAGACALGGSSVIRRKK